MISGARRAALAAVAAVVCMAGIDAGTAGAVEYVNHVGINSGANYFGPFVTLFASETVGYGSGLGCAGIRGVSGVNCEASPGEFVSVVLSKDIGSEPYVHNHSGFKSYFNGYYYS
jgi:hypothetical protein